MKGAHLIVIRRLAKERLFRKHAHQRLQVSAASSSPANVNRQWRCRLFSRSCFDSGKPSLSMEVTRDPRR